MSVNRYKKLIWNSLHTYLKKCIGKLLKRGPCIRRNSETEIHKNKPEKKHILLHDGIVHNSFANSLVVKLNMFGLNNPNYSFMEN